MRWASRSSLDLLAERLVEANHVRGERCRVGTPREVQLGYLATVHANLDAIDVNPIGASAPSRRASPRAPWPSPSIRPDLPAACAPEGTDHSKGSICPEVALPTNDFKKAEARSGSSVVEGRSVASSPHRCAVDRSEHRPRPRPRCAFRYLSNCNQTNSRIACAAPLLKRSRCGTVCLRGSTRRCSFRFRAPSTRPSRNWKPPSAAPCKLRSMNLSG